MGFSGAAARNTFAGRTGLGSVNNARHASFGSDRPFNTNRSSLGNLSARGSGSSWSNASYFHSNGANSNFRGARSANGGFTGIGGRSNGGRFNGANFRNASMSRSGAGRFGAFGNFGSGRNGFNRGGFGGRGFGYGHYGYGHFGYGGWGHRGWGSGGWGGSWWDDPFADLWFLGDIFGLALDVGRFAIMPAWGFLGADLLSTGINALGNLDNNSYNDNSYSYGDNSYGNYQPYGNYQNDSSAEQAYYSAPSRYEPALCGNYYSDENPGCVQ
jgi:hypothetical protein